MKTTLVLATMCVLYAVAPAAGSTLSYADAVPLGTTNWSHSLSFPKFDSTLGTLNYITFALRGHVEGAAMCESRDAAAATVTMNLQAMLRLSRPDDSLLVLAIPVATTTDNVTAWDGLTDYAGTSGKTYPLLSADSAESATSATAADMAIFTGIGNITLPVTAQGASTGSGAGNLSLRFSTSAAAEATVTYDYTAVPEPSTIALLAIASSGLLGFVWRRAKR